MRLRDWLGPVTFLLLTVLCIQIFLTYLLPHIPGEMLKTDYAALKYKTDFVKYSTENPEVVVLGDSRILNGYFPSENRFNLAIFGTSPIDNYYLLKHYFASGKRPKVIVLSYSPAHTADITIAGFWEPAFKIREIYSFMDVTEVYEIALHKQAVFIGSRGSLRFILDFISAKYNALGLFYHEVDLFSKNTSRIDDYENMIERRGYRRKAMTGIGGVDDDSLNPKLLRVSDFVGLYLLKTVALVNAYDAEIIYVETPFPYSGHQVMNKKLRKARDTKIKNIIEADPRNTYIQRKLVYPDSLFADKTHLNYIGSEFYSVYLNALLDNYGQPNYESDALETMHDYIEMRREKDIARNKEAERFQESYGGFNKQLES